jgi:hypothetical protein
MMVRAEGYAGVEFVKRVSGGHLLPRDRLLLATEMMGVQRT